MKHNRFIIAVDDLVSVAIAMTQFSLKVPTSAPKASEGMSAAAIDLNVVHYRNK